MDELLKSSVMKSLTVSGTSSSMPSSAENLSSWRIRHRNTPSASRVSKKTIRQKSLMCACMVTIWEECTLEMKWKWMQRISGIEE